MPASIRRRLLALGILLLAFAPCGAAERAPAGTFSNAECMSCHAQRQPQLVADWRASSHARQSPKADCVTCHGRSHAGAAARARRDAACGDCHAKVDRTVVHSYVTSKHGVLVKLGQDQWDWAQPLDRGNYRAPGCAYCHMHRAEHNVNRTVTPWDPLAAPKGSEGASAARATGLLCGECHAPRYVAEQTATGARMTEIARMKLREARDVIAPHRSTLAGADQHALDDLLSGMQHHVHNVYLGVGHQSPDYQWWHGHPALDGDLLRIKGFVSDLDRRRALAADH